MNEPDKQLKEETKKKVLPALDALLREDAVLGEYAATNTTSSNDFSTSAKSSKEAFHIDRYDKQKFLDAISIEDIECISHTNLNSSEYEEANDTSEAHPFPGQPTRHGKREMKVEGDVHGHGGNSLAGAEARSSFEVKKEDCYEEEPSSVPAHSTRTRRQSTSLLAHKLYLVVQADCSIRVYSHTPVRAGAGIGGAVGIVAGATGGTAGGAAAGALIGSVVPIFGTIIGGIIGAIAGGVGGGVAGGGAGAGLGAGSGAVHSNRVHKTVCAYEVFQKLSDFSHDKNNNSCRCTIIVNTVCPAEHQKLESTSKNN